jgi:hypothetical protein
MGGKSPVEVRAEEACGLAEFSRPREWAEADRARAIVMKRLTEPLGRRWWLLRPWLNGSAWYRESLFVGALT